MKVVTAVRRPVGIAARTNQRRRRRVSILSPAASMAPGLSTAAGEAAETAVAAPGTAARRTRQAAAATTRHEDADRRRPHRTLGGEPERRLDDQGVGQQGRQRSAVAEGVEPVRVDRAGRLRVPHGRVPGRQERRRGGQQERRRTHRHCQDREEVQPGRDRGVAKRCPVGRRGQQEREGEVRDGDVDERPPAEPEPRRPRRARTGTPAAGRPGRTRGRWPTPTARRRRPAAPGARRAARRRRAGTPTGRCRSRRSPAWRVGAARRRGPVRRSWRGPRPHGPDWGWRVKRDDRSPAVPAGDWPRTARVAIQARRGAAPRARRRWRSACRPGSSRSTSRGRGGDRAGPLRASRGRAGRR